jgi:hypothetical protein
MSDDAHMYHHGGMSGLRNPRRGGTPRAPLDPWRKHALQTYAAMKRAADARGVKRPSYKKALISASKTYKVKSAKSAKSVKRTPKSVKRTPKSAKSKTGKSGKGKKRTSAK